MENFTDYETEMIMTCKSKLISKLTGNNCPPEAIENNRTLIYKINAYDLKCKHNCENHDLLLTISIQYNEHKDPVLACIFVSRRCPVTLIKTPMYKPGACCYFDLDEVCSLVKELLNKKTVSDGKPSPFNNYELKMVNSFKDDLISHLTANNCPPNNIEDGHVLIYKICDYYGLKIRDFCELPEKKCVHNCSHHDLLIRITIQYSEHRDPENVCVFISIRCPISLEIYRIYRDQTFCYYNIKEIGSLVKIILNNKYLPYCEKRKIEMIIAYKKMLVSHLTNNGYPPDSIEDDHVLIYKIKTSHETDNELKASIPRLKCGDNPCSHHHLTLTMTLRLNEHDEPKRGCVFAGIRCPLSKQDKSICKSGDLCFYSTSDICSLVKHFLKE